ncbi:hypothetical protein ACIPIC_35680 [Streptomyces collinus]
MTAHADRETERLEHAVRHLLTRTTPAHLLYAVGHALTQPQQGTTP